MSQHYRANGGSAAVIRDELDVAAYLTVRLPATFAAAAAALGEAAALLPNYAPASLLDIGAGPGPASWAGIATWPAIGAVTMVDANPHFLRAARTLAEASSSPALRRAAFVQANISDGMGRLPRAELVIAAYALAELAEREAVEAATAAWDRCDGVLLIVEPGTSEGFRRIRSPATLCYAAALMWWRRARMSWRVRSLRRIGVTSRSGSPAHAII